MKPKSSPTNSENQQEEIIELDENQFEELRGNIVEEEYIDCFFE